MVYRDIIKKYLHYMREKEFLSGEEELILETCLVEDPPKLDYKRVYDLYCKDKIILIPSAYWNDDELKAL